MNENIFATKNDVATIGKGTALLATVADKIAAAAPEDFDTKRRGAVADLIRKHIEPGQRMTGPKGAQVKTQYGEGFAALESAVKSRLNKGKGSSDKYVTTAGLKAADWDTFVRKAYAEWTAANENKNNTSVESVDAA